MNDHFLIWKDAASRHISKNPVSSPRLVPRGLRASPQVPQAVQVPTRKLLSLHPLGDRPGISFPSKEPRVAAQTSLAAFVRGIHKRTRTIRIVADRTELG